MTAWEASLERELSFRANSSYQRGFECGWEEAAKFIAKSFETAPRLQFTRPQASRYAETIAALGKDAK